MKRFTHIDPATIEEAVFLLKEYQGAARVIAGGSDLVGGLKDNLWMRYPKAVINLKTIPGLREIRADADGLHIGALATLTEVAESAVVREGWPGLAEAARRTASPLLRNIGTIAGNICQENRCWYYRYPHKLGGRIDCVRKGGTRCLAVTGDHRYHSIFGAVKKCVAVNPSDTAPALVALDAVVQTNKRAIPIDGFFSAERGAPSTVLEGDEIVTGVFVPTQGPGGKSAFQKIAVRKSIDFALVNCAAAVTCLDGVVTAARICLNGVHNNPRRCDASEAALLGRALNAETAGEAGELAVAQAKPLLMNAFKVPMARTIVADTLLACI
ncbi:molybdopterin dehydrogenase [Desulfovibrio sulfodismutans]|uniref:Molybdopterin dehydrogenase n=1 Tax=Desulfolutivibrio sulfodismutans TaxID=63561 RepID=A0A7K3NJN3_9BACT|nr:FAD binding domain-containing protein [Desulfolutivibrio sulfodismutans]NDY55429.1 molybdopterin dehydrogenase [Desulfolutivibrio sulfodismutans]QLA12199.1 molybdopterin dehydrogenase [Desulfolutivibrio sulfodismutans DSM 3696]